MKFSNTMVRTCHFSLSHVLEYLDLVEKFVTKFSTEPKFYFSLYVSKADTKGNFHMDLREPGNFCSIFPSFVETLFLPPCQTHGPRSEIASY